MHLGEPNIWHIFSPRYLPEINAAAAEAEKLNEAVGGSMGWKATTVIQSLSGHPESSLVPERAHPVPYGTACQSKSKSFLHEKESKVSNYLRYF